MNPHIFRQYDIRGMAERDLTDPVAYRIGQAFARLVHDRQGSRVVLGHDVRLSSPRLHAQVAAGLVASGLEVIDLGFMPTPGVYFAAHHDQADGGLIVTGSHNPAEYNGFKMLLRQGPVYGEQIQQMRRIIEEGDFISGQGSQQSRSILSTYLDAIVTRVHLRRPFHVAIDAGNGTAGPAVLQLMESLGCRVEALYCDPDGTFPHHLADPTVPAFMRDLSDRVMASGAEIGIGLDGDGDRIGVVDERGRLIFGDQLLALYARDVLERTGRGQKIIFDVKCSQALIEDIEAHGGQPVMWKTGHSLIKAEMKRSKAPLAGEMSGHMFFAENWFGFDDALYAAARLLGLLDRWEVSIGEAVDSLPRYFSTPEMRVSCSDEVKFEVVDEITRRFRKRSGIEVVDIDGARVITPEGWGLVRVSNTQPVIVLRFEGRTPEALEEVRQMFIEVLSDFPEVALEELDGEANDSGH